MRLIDADDTIRIIKAYRSFEGELFTERDERLIKYICAHIEHLQPTAYDVEAVVEELNAKGNEFFAKAVNAEIKGESLFAEICKMAAAAVYESADIVKRGGRNE